MVLGGFLNRNQKNDSQFSYLIDNVVDKTTTFLTKEIWETRHLKYLRLI